MPVLGVVCAGVACSSGGMGGMAAWRCGEVVLGFRLSSCGDAS